MGSDDAALKKWIKSSAGLVCLRSLDMGPECRGKLTNCAPLIIRPSRARFNGAIPNLLPYLSDFRAAMKRWATPGTPLTLRNGAQVSVHWLLATGDTPMVTKALSGHGHSGYHGDYRRFFTGVYAGGAIHYYGYSQPQAQAQNHTKSQGNKSVPLYPTGAIFQYGVDPVTGALTAQLDASAGGAIFSRDAPRASHEQIVAAGKTADSMVRRGLDAALIPLVKGFSICIDSDGNTLPGIRLDKCMPLPIYHKAAFGVGKKGTLQEFFVPFRTDGKPEAPWVVSRARRAAMANKFPNGTFMLLPSCSRPYWDVAKHFSGLIMEEVVVFWCTLAPIVLSKAWSDDDKDDYYPLVTLLSKAFRIVFNFNSDLADTRTAEDLLHEFAERSEKLYLAGKLPASFGSHNLMVLVNELVAGHIATGTPGATNELWIERFIRHVIRRGQQASTGLEAFIVNEMCRLMILRDVLSGFGLPVVAQKRPRKCFDDSAPSPHGNTFSSAGTPFTSSADDYDEVLAELLLFAGIAEEQDVAGTAALLWSDPNHPPEITQYTTAEIGRLDIHAVTYNYCKVRNATRVSVKYTVAEAEADTARRATIRTNLHALEVGIVPHADASRLVGKRVASLFQRGIRKEWFPAVVTGASATQRGRFRAQFWDNDASANAKHWTEAEVRQGMLDYELYVAPVLGRQGVHTRTEFEYGTVDRFFLVKVGAAVHRFAFVTLLKVVPTSSDRAYTTLNGGHVLGDSGAASRADADVIYRVVDIDSIHGNMLFYKVPGGDVSAPRFLATPFVKN
jgi:hypothetical protein